MIESTTNMNRFIIIFFFILFGINQTVLSQELISPDILNPLENRVHSSGLPVGEINDFGQARLLDNNHIVYSVRYSHFFTPNVDRDTFYNDILEGDQFKLSLRDTNMAIVNEWYSNVHNSDTVEARFVHMIQETNDHIIVIGSGTNDTLEANQWHLFEFTFDKNLLLEDSKWFTIPLDLSYANGIADVIINHRGNYVFTGLVINPDNNLPEHKEKFICELSKDGEVINYHAPLQRRFASEIDGAILQMDNGSYLVHPFHILDTLFNEVAQYEGHGYEVTPKMVEINNDQFIFSGTKLHFTSPPNIQQTELEVLAVSDMNGNWNNIFLNDLDSYFDTSPGVRALDTRDTSCIYFATSRGTFIFQETNFVDVYSVSFSGGMNWGYTFGGDASYNPSNVVALPNGKCLLIVSKVKHCPEGLKGDIEYVIFDKYGEIVDLSTGLNKNLLQKIPASIYPNPANSELSIELDDSFLRGQLDFELVTLSGQSVMRKTINIKETINVQMIPSGMYVVKIYNNGQPIYSRKVVIEH